MIDVRETRPVAIVTGAARGLGAETARQLVMAGWRVLLVDCCSDNSAIPYQLATPQELEETLAVCRAVAGDDQVASIVADVRRQEELEAAVHFVLERFGRLDAAVASAGVIAGGSPAWRTPDDIWHAIFEVDLVGVWHLARAVMPVLLAQSEPRQGRFVAVSSAAGLRGLPRLAAYSAAKHGVIGLVRSMAAELGESGVTANVVCPGSMDTAMLKASAALYGLPNTREFAKYHRTNKLVTCGEVAGLIVWLCSPASSGITGAVLSADGGMTASQ